MSNLPRWSSESVALLIIGLAGGAVAPLVTFIPDAAIVAPASAQATFPDVSPNYWAQPFIQTLAERNIVVGYPDGTFRPEQPLERDEFAAIIRKAFDQNQVRQIPSGSVFKDVPAGYWAAPPIEEAYETGFMKGSPSGLFRPRQEVSRVEALVSLINGLNLSLDRPQVTTNQATTNQATTNPTTTNQATNQATTEQATTNPTTTNQATTNPTTTNQATNPTTTNSTTTNQATTEQATTNQATNPITTNSTTTNQATTNQATTNPTTTNQATTNQPTANQATRRRARKKPVFFPLAITSLMQPVLIASANGQGVSPSVSTASGASDQGVSPSGSASTVGSGQGVSPSGSASTVGSGQGVSPSDSTASGASGQGVSPSDSTASGASGQGVSPSGSTASGASDQGVSFNRPASSIVSKYYTDAEKIPQYALDDVAAATTVNIVVNYPNVKVLNPNEPLTRGAAAALIYQTLVYQGKLQPLPSNVEASNYIVGRTTSSNQNTQTTQ